MKKNFLYFLLLSWFSIGGLLLAEESFVIPKKRRIVRVKPENIAQGYGEIIKKTSDLSLINAHIQKKCVEKTQELLENSIASSKLQEADAAVANCLEVIQDCQKKIQQAFSSVCRCTE